MPSSFRSARVIAAALLLLPAAIVARPADVAAVAAAPRPTSAVAEGSARAEAVRTQRPVELAAQGTETAQVFVNPDGHHTLIQHAQPVRVRRGSRWATIDPTLTRQADGSIVPIATAERIVFAGGGSTILVRLGRPGQQVRLTWPTPLPAPRLAADTATYPEVLPGVDLQLRAEPRGFSHLLVVKNAAAARNPALRTIGFGVAGDGLRIASGPGGTLTAKDSAGHLVFATGQATMWDSHKGPDGSPDRPAPISTTFANGRLALRPDRALLSGAGVAYPVFVDPSWTGAAGNMWTHVNRGANTMSYWVEDRATGAKVGAAWNDPPHMYRSLFQLDTSPIGGARVISARFTIVLDHTPTRDPQPVELWQTRSISRSAPVTWNNTTGHWLQRLDTQSGNAHTGDQPNMTMGFAGDALKTLVQKAADERIASLGFGLKAESEDNQNQWKKFLGETASIVVEYNTPARVPLKVNFTDPRPCGTAAAPTMIRDPEPRFAAVGSDPDGDSLTNRLEIHRVADDGLAYQADAGPTSSGAAFSWSAVPGGKLQDGVPYYYLARSDDGVAGDGVDFGPASPRCYFQLDRVAPGKPVLASTAFPNGTAGIPIRTVGVISLGPAAGGDGVIAYRYGFVPDKITLQIKAGADGSAQLPITVIPAPLPTKTLYVQALDQAGNPSETTRWNIIAKSTNAPPAANVRGDVNGDGLADVTAVIDQGAGRTGIWNVPATASGFATGTLSWDSNTNGGFPLSRTLAVQGDFTGDGVTDQALVHDEAGRRVAIYLNKSDGNRYDLQSLPVWRSDGPAWSISTAHVIAGDVDGDRRDDIVVQLDSGNGNWRTLVYPGSNLAAPVQWLQTATGTGPWAKSRPVIADLDGDGKDDLVVLKDLGGCRTGADLFRSTGTTFAPAVSVFDGENFCSDRAHPMPGDVDGDGKDDLVALYDNGTTGTDTSLRVLRSTGTALVATEWWHDNGRFDAVRTTLSVGDHNGDRRDDAALVTALDGGGREVFDLLSTGTSFGAPASVWREPAVGASTGPRVEIEPRTYELVSRNTGRCLEVAGASQTDPANVQQWDCAGGLHQRFRIVPVNGTDQFQIQMVHEGVDPADGSPRCMDVGNQSVADNTPIVQWKCVGTANQQVFLDYVEGSSYDTVVRVRFAHSGKCADLSNPAAGNGAALVQLPCDATRSTQQWVVRAALNTPQLTGRFAVRSVMEGGFVLDMTDCTITKGLRFWDLVDGSPCQHWDFRPLGDDLYQIVDPQSNTALQVQGCSRADAAKVSTLSIDDSECQRWRVEPAVDGSYTIQQAETGKTLDAAACKDERGVEPIVWPYWNGPCQRWSLER